MVDVVQEHRELVCPTCAPTLVMTANFTSQQSCKSAPPNSTSEKQTLQRALSQTACLEPTSKTVNAYPSKVPPFRTPSWHELHPGMKLSIMIVATLEVYVCELGFLFGFGECSVVVSFSGMVLRIA